MRTTRVGLVAAVGLALLSCRPLALSPLSSFAPGQASGFTLLLWGSNHPDSQVTDLLGRAQRIGANHVQIPVTQCQKGIRDNEVGSCKLSAHTGTWEDIARYVRLAKQMGMTFSLLPIVGTPQWEWRGQFDPSDPARWFTTYGDWILQIARASREWGATEVIAGSEFGAIYKYDTQWRELIAQIRTEFKGPVVVTANWQVTDLSFWDAADAIGISAYYPLARQLDAPQEQLDQSWSVIRAHLTELSRRWNRPLHFTEVGYPSNTFAATEPWQSVENQTPHWALQERCLRAFARAWAPQGHLDPLVVRAVVWSLESLSEKRYAVGFNPIGKPAESVLEGFFRSL